MELFIVSKCYFVTGTDTEVGKTVASVALLQAAKQRGWIAAGYKPVASGSEMTCDGLRNSDALLLQSNSGLPLLYSSVNLYTFIEPTSPHIISVNNKIPIKFSRLTHGLRKLKSQAEWILVEGAGGWFTPLTSTQTFADWVIHEKLLVILVVGIKSGCINHAILTSKVIIHAGLRLAGWIANNILPPNRWHAEYLLTLKRMLRVPFLGEIPWSSTKIEKTNIGHYLNLNVLNPKLSNISGK